MPCRGLSSCLSAVSCSGRGGGGGGGGEEEGEGEEGGEREVELSTYLILP